MPQKRVLIINVRSLLMESVIGLLASKGSGDLDVISTIVDSLPELINEVREVKPSIVVLDEVTSLTRPAELIASLLHVQNIRIIALNSGASRMDIYDKSNFTVSHPSQFIEALNFEGSPLHHWKGGGM